MVYGLGVRVQGFGVEGLGVRAFFQRQTLPEPQEHVEHQPLTVVGAIC